MGFSDNLKRARQRVGMTQQQIAEGLGITKSTYCGYETGKRQPDILKLRRLAFLLCTTTDALLSVNCDAPECTVTAREYEQFILFRQLPPESQRMVRLVFDEEQRRSHASRTESSVSGASVTLRIAQQGVSDEEDAYLGPDGFRTACLRPEALETLPADAVFALPVSGNSLEPRYHDGDVLVVSPGTPNPGDTGVFLRGCMGVVRLMGHDELFSLNPVEPPLPLDQSLRPCGVVTGVLRPEDVLY